jgi:hypothetical protein
MRKPRDWARRISSIASRPETWTISTGTSTSSESMIARCVASRSTGMGREAAWSLGAPRPAASSFSDSHAMQSLFSAWIIVMAPSRRASASTSRIWRSSSFMSS